MHVQDDQETFERNDGSTCGDWGYGEGSCKKDYQSKDYFKKVRPSSRNDYFDIKNTHWGFWKKRCKKEFPLHDVSEHDGSWKRTYLEAYVAKMLETFEPGVKKCVGKDKTEEVSNSYNNVTSKINSNVGNKNNAKEKNTKNKCPNIYKLSKYKGAKKENEKALQNDGSSEFNKEEKNSCCCCKLRLTHLTKLLSPHIKALYVTQLQIEPKVKKTSEYNNKINVQSSNNMLSTHANKQSLSATKASAGNVNSGKKNYSGKSNISSCSERQLADNLMLAKQSRMCAKLMDDEEDDDDEKNHVDFSKIFPAFTFLEKISLQFSAKRCGMDHNKNNFKASLQDCINLAKGIQECHKLR